MKFNTRDDIPPEWGNPNPAKPRWIPTRYVEWTSWLAGSQQWGLSSMRQGENAMAVIAITVGIGVAFDQIILDADAVKDLVLDPVCARIDELSGIHPHAAMEGNARLGVELDKSARSAEGGTVPKPEGEKPALWFRSSDSDGLGRHGLNSRAAFFRQLFWAQLRSSWSPLF
jgi:hypothetical protein